MFQLYEKAISSDIYTKNLQTYKDYATAYNKETFIKEETDKYFIAT